MTRLLFCRRVNRHVGADDLAGALAFAMLFHGRKRVEVILTAEAAVSG
jgi:hypothetical protein